MRLNVTDHCIVFMHVSQYNNLFNCLTGLVLVGGFVHGPQDIIKNSALCNRHGNRMNRSFNYYSSLATADIAHYAL